MIKPRPTDYANKFELSDAPHVVHSSVCEIAYGGLGVPRTPKGQPTQRGEGGSEREAAYVVVGGPGTPEGTPASPPSTLRRGLTTS